MMSSNGNIFRVTGHFAGNSPVPGEFPTQRPVTRSFDFNFDLRINGWVNNRQAGDLRRHRAHYDVIVMTYLNLDDKIYWCLSENVIKIIGQLDLKRQISVKITLILFRNHYSILSSFSNFFSSFFNYVVMLLNFIFGIYFISIFSLL